MGRRDKRRRRNKKTRRSTAEARRAERLGFNVPPVPREHRSGCRFVLTTRGAARLAIQGTGVVIPVDFSEPDEVPRRFHASALALLLAKRHEEEG